MGYATERRRASGARRRVAAGRDAARPTLESLNPRRGARENRPARDVDSFECVLSLVGPRPERVASVYHGRTVGRLPTRAAAVLLELDTYRCHQGKRGKASTCSVAWIGFDFAPLWFPGEEE